MLESRQLLSATSISSRFFSEAAQLAPAVLNVSASAQQATPLAAQSGVLPSVAVPPIAASSASTRWDWLANTEWYVP